MNAPEKTFFRRANGVLMIREADGRVRPATLEETAEISTKAPRRRWFRRTPKS